MSEDWYYFQNGNQAGPVDESVIQQMLASGRLSWDDLVWHDGLPDWLPAAQIPQLASSRVSAPAPPPFVPPPAQAAAAPRFQAQPAAAVAAPVLSPIPALSPAVGAPLGFGGVSENTIAILAKTRPWVRLLSIVTFIGVGLLILSGVAGMVMGFMGGGGGIAGVGIGAAALLIYILVAALVVPVALFLNRYAKAIGGLQSSRGTGDLERALLAQKSYWKYVGILSVIGIALSILGVIGGIIFGLAGLYSSY